MPSTLQYSASESGNKPLVSVIIPAYDAAAYIQETLRSVFSQTYDNYEVIVVNDGSNDTAELHCVLTPYLDRIVYVQQRNAGPSAARNTGIRHARGDYLAFLDSDDRWLPDSLASQVAFAFSNEPPYDLVYGDMLLVADPLANPHGKGREIRYFDKCPSVGEVNFASLLMEQCQVPTSGSMLRRELAIRAGLFDEELRRAEDYGLWLRVAHQGASMAFHRNVVGVYRVRDTSLSSDNIAMLESAATVLKKLDRLPSLSPSDRSVLNQKLQDLSTLVELERGKVALLKGNYRDAICSLASANAIKGSWRVSCAIYSLKLVPNLMGPLLQLLIRGSSRRSQRLRVVNGY
ncbi:MAG: glycosyltransferase family 2 protein [Steroidobacteraceae bacterium]